VSAARKELAAGLGEGSVPQGVRGGLGLLSIGLRYVAPFYSFLFALYLAIDANFRLCRRDVSSEAKDPGIMRGWAFFGAVTQYMAHLEAHVGETQEVSLYQLGSGCITADADFRGVHVLLMMPSTSLIVNLWARLRPE
jgi:hypothetical protein